MISENLHAIFGFALKRVANTTEAEDLTQDIVAAMLGSVHRLRDDAAFWGYMWKIAAHTYQRHLRKNRHRTVVLDEASAGGYWAVPADASPEAVCCRRETLNTLRRELSLLSARYRAVTVAHYIEGLSCAQIAAAQGISIEMTKYYLYKTRKILKEGMGMTRTYGEKSYNPAPFRMDFWGNDSTGFWALFQRKLPGNILLAAYDVSLDVQALAVELGVSVAYLEDELDILIRHELLIALPGGRYQTNIIIFDQTVEDEMTQAMKPVIAQATKQLGGKLSALAAQLGQISFQTPQRRNAGRGPLQSASTGENGGNVVASAQDFDTGQAVDIAAGGYAVTPAQTASTGKTGGIAVPTQAASARKQERATRSAHLLWTLVTLVMAEALAQSDAQSRKQFGDYPPLVNGGYGFVFGYASDRQHPPFNGIYDNCENMEGTAWFAAYNYRIIEKYQRWDALPDWANSLQAMNDAVLGTKPDPNNDMLPRLIDEGFIAVEEGRLAAQFAVFTQEQFDAAKQVVAPIAAKMAGHIRVVCAEAGRRLKARSPKGMANRCEQVACVRYQMEMLAFVVEALVENGALPMPEEGEKAAVFGVAKGSQREAECFVGQ